MIIYPPLITDTINAFTSSKVKITFNQNPAVGWDLVEGFILKVIDPIEQKEKAILTQFNASAIVYDEAKQAGTVTFNFGTWKPSAKQHYKFQISYSDGSKNSAGTQYLTAYSAASFGYCIGSTPSIIIKGLQTSSTNKDLGKYEGKYNHINSDPIYSYRFKLLRKDTETVIDDTGDILYSINEKTNPTYTLKHELNSKITYTLQFLVTSVNGYSAASSKYQITKNTATNTEPSCKISVTQENIDKQNGTVKVQLTTTSTCKAGSFIIDRTSDGIVWEELIMLTLFEDTTDLSKCVWRDYSVEQGMQYQYAIKTFNPTSYLCGKRKTSEIISVDYENIYLSDNERQLKVLFNPQINSFKNVIQESKTETIGGQYPFFFRNGNINYKEFSISGLISYHMDEDQSFITDDELGLINLSNGKTITRPETTNLDSLNFAFERKFKLETLNWLNNGKPKLLRGPGEGVYVVRLMNVSLSANAQLGRMLHSFTATAYEVSNNDLNTLKSKGVFSFSNGESKPISQFGYFLLGYDAVTQ